MTCGAHGRRGCPIVHLPDPDHVRNAAFISASSFSIFAATGYFLKKARCPPGALLLNEEAETSRAGLGHCLLSPQAFRQQF